LTGALVGKADGTSIGRLVRVMVGALDGNDDGI
jgi:hypothetical protein